MTIRDHFGFSFYVIFHPFKGFHEMKYEERGKVGVALIVLALLAVAIIAKQQFTGFIVNFTRAQDFRTLNQLAYVFVPFFLWCIANWSTTTLMDGEGSFPDIVMATGYALVPMVVLYFMQTVVSNVITQPESAFYYFLGGLAIAWFIGLLFAGTMTVHQYTASKTLLTMMLTVLVCGIIVFIAMLFFSLIQQMVGFIATIYKEIAFRI